MTFYRCGTIFRHFQRYRLKHKQSVIILESSEWWNGVLRRFGGLRFSVVKCKIRGPWIQGSTLIGSTCFFYASVLGPYPSTRDAH